MICNVRTLDVFKSNSRRLLDLVAPFSLGIARRPARRSWFEQLEDRVVLSTIAVTSLADNGPGTLHAAIDKANLDPTQDTIRFDPSIKGTIVLTEALPDLSTAIAIVGPGASQLAVACDNSSGSLNFRIFNVSNSAQVSISGLTLTQGTVDGIGGSA